MNTKLTALIERNTEAYRAPQSADLNSKKAAPEAVSPEVKLFGPNFDAEMDARDRRDRDFFRRHHAETAGAFVKMGAATSAVLGGSALLVAGAVAGPVAAAAAGIALGLTGVPFMALGVIHWATTR